VANAGQRRFLIQFIVDADDAVQNSTRLSKALNGVGAKMNVAAANLKGAVPAVNQVSKGLGKGTTKLKATTKATGGLAEQLTTTNKRAMTSTRRFLELIRLSTGLGFAFRGLARGNPVAALLGLSAAMVRVERLFFRGKKKADELTGAQAKLGKGAKKHGLIYNHTLKPLKKWAKGLGMVKSLNTKILAPMKAFRLGMSKQGSAVMAFRGMLGGRLHGKGVISGALQKNIGMLKKFNAAGARVGKGFRAMGAPASKVLGVFGRLLFPLSGLFIKVALIAAVLLPLIAIFSGLMSALKPVIAIFKLIASVLSVFGKVVFLPLTLMFTELLMVVAELLQPIMELTESLMPVAMIFGKLLVEPIKLLGKLLIPFAKELFNAMGGMDGLASVLVDVAGFMRELSGVMSETVIIVFDTLRDMMPEIVMFMKASLKIIGLVIKGFAYLFLLSIKLFGYWVKYIGGPVYKVMYWTLGKALEFVLDLFADIQSGIESIVYWSIIVGKALWKGIVWPFEKIAEVAKSVWNWLFGSSLFHIAEGISQILSPMSLLTSAFGGIQKIIELVSIGFDALKSVGVAAWEGIKSVWSGAKGVFSKAWGWITGAKEKAAAPKTLTVTQQAMRDNLRGLDETRKAGEEYRKKIAGKIAAGLPLTDMERMAASNAKMLPILSHQNSELAKAQAGTAAGLPLTVTQKAMRDNLRGLGELRAAGAEYRKSVAAKQSAGIHLTPMEKMAAHNATIADPTLASRSLQARHAPAPSPEPGARPVPHTSAAAASAAVPIKITVPVTVQLDGFVLARAVAEYLTEIGRDRFQNEPQTPMRGVI
jgi:hypothetical protein